MSLVFDGLCNNIAKVLELFDEGLKVYDSGAIAHFPDALEQTKRLDELCAGHGCSGCYQRIIGDFRLGGSCLAKNDRKLFAQYFVGYMLEQELLERDWDALGFAPTSESLDDLLEE